MKLSKREGWANVFTWAVALEIDNNRTRLIYWLARARMEGARVKWENGQRVCASAQTLEAELEAEFHAEHEAAGDGEPTILENLAWHALHLVDWREIADHLRAKVAEGVTA